MPASSTRVVTMNQTELRSRFGGGDFGGALCGYTPEIDTHIVLTLLVQAKPRRVLEVGTALGHMTANLTRWTIDDAQIFSLGIIRGMERSAPGAAEQGVDVCRSQSNRVGRRCDIQMSPQRTPCYQNDGLQVVGRADSSVFISELSNA